MAVVAEKAPVEYDRSAITSIDTIRTIVGRAEKVITALQEAALEPTQMRKQPRWYSITEVARLIGKSTNGIRQSEAAGALPTPALNERGRRAGYTLADINVMRAHYRIQVGRQPDEKPVRMAFQNFKGGVGKTTLTCHYAQYLAERGYRVLLIDADSQGSATMTFGFQPDVEIDAEQTLYPFLCGEEDSLRYAIRETHWDRLDLIPANLDLYAAEYHLAAISGSSDNANWIEMLSLGIETVEDDYDVILIDAPPALGMISLNVLRALTGLIIPAPAAMMDFHSTASFLRMLDEILSSISKTFGETLEFDFFKILISKFDTQKPAQDFVSKLTSQQFAGHMLQSWFVQSAEIDNASTQWQTVFELEKPIGSARTYKRCVDSLKAVFAEIETETRRTWPSHRHALSGVTVDTAE